MNKRKIFGIALFIIVGLFMFTFANPNEKVDDKEEKNVSVEQNDKNDVDTKEEVKPVAIIPTEESVVRTSRVEVVENTIPTVVEDNTLELQKALELENAKKAAIEELENYKKDYNYTDSTKRQDIVDEYTKAINDAKELTDVDRLKENGKEAIDKLVKEDLENYIEEAIKNIENYKQEDEKYISKITDEKSTSIEELKELEDKESIDELVEKTLKTIDDIINNKTFKVTFIGKGNVKEEQTVKYKESAQAPSDDSAFANPTYKNVSYKLDETNKFDTDFSSVKSDLTVKANYVITNIKATIYLNNKEIPNPKTRSLSGKGTYTNLGTVNLKLDNKKINESILKDKNANIYTNDDLDITTLFNDNPNIPALENKYDYYEYYVVKFVAGSQAGIHIDCVKKHNSAQEELDKLNDAKDRLNDLINSLPKNCNETYTSATCSALDKTVNDLKNVSTLTEIENAITEITNAKNNLVEIVLDHITLTLNGDTYYLNGDKATLKVEAFYNDEIKNGEINNYKVVTAFDNTSVGSREVKVSYTFNGVTKEASVPYKVIYTNEQLNAKTKNINSSIDWHLEWSKTSWWPHAPYISGIGFTINFSNIDEDVEAAYIHKTTDNIFTNSDQVITLTKTNDKNVFNVSWNDYKRLWSNNTLFAGQYIYITYKIGDQTYTQRYKERNSKLYID